MQSCKLNGTKETATGAYEKILHLFFAFPIEEFSLNEIAKRLAIAKTTARQVIKDLEKEGFVKKKVIGKLWQIKAYQSHKYFTTKKIPYNLQLVYESGVIEWIKKNVPEAKATILFGSYRKGDDIATSDIDIAVEIVTEKGQKIIEGKIQAMGYRKDVPVQIHCFSQKKIDANLFANIANGIIIEGFIEVHQ